MPSNSPRADDASLPPVPESSAQPGRLAQALSGTGFGGTGFVPPPQGTPNPFSMPAMPNFTGVTTGAAAASGTGSGSDGSVAASPFGPFAGHGAVAAAVPPGGAGAFGGPVARPMCPPFDAYSASSSTNASSYVFSRPTPQ